MFLVSYEDQSYNDRDIVLVGLFEFEDTARDVMAKKGDLKYHMHLIDSTDAILDEPIGCSCFCMVCVERFQKNEMIRKESLNAAKFLDAVQKLKSAIEPEMDVNLPTYNFEDVWIRIRFDDILEACDLVLSGGDTCVLKTKIGNTSEFPPSIADHCKEVMTFILSD